ncbi:MAG: DUF4270 domain-containing protein [Nonlabens sp.]
MKISSFLAGIFLVVLIVSCDNDPTTLGSEFINVDPNGTILEDDFMVKTFSNKLNAVQTDNFTSALVGSYSDGVYGQSNFDFVTQVQFSAVNPNFGEDPELSKVVIDIPYYSTPIGTSGEATLYEIDSTYGDGSINLKIYRNRFFLSAFNSNDVTQRATYFSDENPVEGLLVPDDLILNQGDLVPDAVEVEVMDDDNNVVERLSPRLRVEQSVDGSQTNLISYFNELILDQEGTQNLSSASNFNNYFRGLYFQAENVNDELIYLDYQNAFIELTVTSTQNINGVDQRFDSAFRITPGGIAVNFIESNIPQSTLDEIQNGSEASGSEKMYLKGGDGSIALIDLFSGEPDPITQLTPLEELQLQEILVNDAFIEFYVDQSAALSNTEQPERIVIYNAETRSPLADFLLSETERADVVNSNLFHLGRLQREDEGNVDSPGVKYRINVTDHVNNIILGNIDNDRLALAVSQNVNLFNRSEVDGITQPVEIPAILLGTAISHEGTVLHGNLSSDLSKRPVLKLFYTPTK